jgi:hypothetical protein
MWTDFLLRHLLKLMYSSFETMCLWYGLRF